MLHRLDPKRDGDVVMLQHLKISSLDHAVGGRRAGFKSLCFERLLHFLSVLEDE